MSKPIAHVVDIWPVGIATVNCPRCEGGGRLIRQATTESCQTCGGTGLVTPERRSSLIEIMVRFPERTR
jgi:DnaJ-class molecular chaperone